MTTQLWIACAFSAALVVFLMITYFARDTSSAAQQTTLRFLRGLCAGFAGGFFAGEALFRMEGALSSGLRVFISGTAGCALFLVVWFTYAKPDDKRTGGVTLSIPKGWTFEQAARGVAKAARATVVFEGLEPFHLAIKLPEVDISAPTVDKALKQLQYSSRELPEYQVKLKEGLFHIQA